MHRSLTVFLGTLSFLLGIASASLDFDIYALLLFVFAGGFTTLALLKKLNLWRYVIILTAAIFIGAFYHNFYLNAKDLRQNIVFNEQLTFVGVVRSEPREFEKYKSFEIKLRDPMHGNAMVLTSPLKDINYGDVLEISGRIDPPASGFEKASVPFPEIKITGTGDGLWIKEKLLALKGLFLEQFRKYLSQDQASLLGGITFGARSGFSEELRNSMAKSGTTHIVALSGYNITILVVGVAYVLGSIMSRRKVFYATAIIISLFVLMVGGEPSVIRAAIMGFLALFAKEAGRTYSMRNAIVFTAAAMALFNPTILIHDIGFRLSFLSLLGIVYLAPAVRGALRIKEGDFLGWRENLALTFSAQLMVMPVLILVFGEFSITSVLANVLILGFVPLTMFLGFTLSVVSAIFTELGFFIAKLVEVLLVYEIQIIKIFSILKIPIELPFGASYLLPVIYYGLVAFFIYSPTRKNKIILTRK